VSANFVSGVGKFRDINEEGTRRAGEAVFELCYIMHDEFLNESPQVEKYRKIFTFYSFA
jgi:hypothetical protein